MSYVIEICDSDIQALETLNDVKVAKTTLFFTDFFDFTSIGFFVHLKTVVSGYPDNVFLTCHFTERLAVLKHF